MTGIGLGLTVLGGVFAAVMFSGGGYASLAGAAGIALMVAPGLGLALGARAVRLSHPTMRALAFAVPALLAAGVIGVERWEIAKREARWEARDARVLTGTLGGHPVTVPLAPAVSLEVDAPEGWSSLEGRAGGLEIREIAFRGRGTSEQQARTRRWCEARSPRFDGTPWCAEAPFRLTLVASREPLALQAPIGTSVSIGRDALGVDATGEPVRYACRRVSATIASCRLRLALAEGVGAKMDASSPPDEMLGRLERSVAQARLAWSILSATGGGEVPAR